MLETYIMNVIINIPIVQRFKIQRLKPYKHLNRDIIQSFKLSITQDPCLKNRLVQLDGVELPRWRNRLVQQRVVDPARSKNMVVRGIHTLLQLPID